MSTKPEDLQKVLSDYLNNYREDIQEDVEELTDSITKQARDELKATSPKSGLARKTKYYAGWSVKLQNKGKLKYHKVVWNRTNYQLTHLLEFGHLKRNGTGWVDPSPKGGHIRPVEEKYKVEFVDKLKQKIRRTK